MPKLAILSDVHANLPALEAVLAEVDDEGIDDIFFGGDIVGYGAHAAECIELVRSRGGRCVLGNHDFYTLAARKNPDLIPHGGRGNPVWAGVAHAAETIGDDHAAWLGGLPQAIDLPLGILAHAALHKPDEWPYLHSEREAKPTLKTLRRHRIGVGFFGHTHAQDLFADPAAAAVPEYLGSGAVSLPEGTVCAVLVGAVGQPRDSDLRAAWALWDTDRRVVEFRRTAYPALAAALAIVASGLPSHSAARLLDEEGLAELRKIVS